LVKSGLYEQAVQFFDRALVLDKNTSAVIYNNRGYAQMRLGRNELAMDDFNRAIQADHQYIPAYLNKATLLKNVKDYVRCEEELNMVLRLEPDNAVAFNNIRILKRMINEQVTR
jgi:tetratricopeptide (TPR) repeat protein